MTLGEGGEETRAFRDISPYTQKAMHREHEEEEKHRLIGRVVQIQCYLNLGEGGAQWA